MIRNLMWLRYWRYLVRNFGAFWFMRRPLSWWSPSLRMSFLSSLAMDAFTAGFEGGTGR